MPRLAHSIPKYRKHKASGQAVVTLSGVDHYLGPHGTKASKLSYDRLVAEWLAGGRCDPAGHDSLSVVELCARYYKHALQYYQKDGRCTGVAPAVKCVIRYLKAWYGEDSVAEFTPVALKALRQKMLEDGLSRRYINDHVNRIKRMFRWGVSEGLVPVEVVQSLATVEGLRKGRSQAREAAPRRPVTDEQLAKTLPHLTPTVRAMVELQRQTGMRPGELVILRPGDIDRSDQVWRYTPASHKTDYLGKNRKVYIGPRGQEVLRPFLLRGADQYCFSPREAVAEHYEARHAARTTPLSQGNRPAAKRHRSAKRPPGARYSVDSYRRAVQRAAEAAGVEPWSPGLLRHTFATEVRAKHGLEASQVLLGHSHANVTEHYAMRDEALAREIAAKTG
ncbi:MAG: site-specific integrase [Planctomycetota bacterium]